MFDTPVSRRHGKTTCAACHTADNRNVRRARQATTSRVRRRHRKATRTISDGAISHDGAVRPFRPSLHFRRHHDRCCRDTCWCTGRNSHCVASSSSQAMNSPGELSNRARAVASSHRSQSGRRVDENRRAKADPSIYSSTTMSKRLERFCRLQRLSQCDLGRGDLGRLRCGLYDFGLLRSRPAAECRTPQPTV